MSLIRSSRPGQPTTAVIQANLVRVTDFRERLIDAGSGNANIAATKVSGSVSLGRFVERIGNLGSSFGA